MHPVQVARSRSPCIKTAFARHFCRFGRPPLPVFPNLCHRPLFVISFPPPADLSSPSQPSGRRSTPLPFVLFGTRLVSPTPRFARFPHSGSHFASTPSFVENPLYVAASATHRGTRHTTRTFSLHSVRFSATFKPPVGRAVLLQCSFEVCRTNEDQTKKNERCNRHFCSSPLPSLSAPRFFCRVCRKWTQALLRPLFGFLERNFSPVFVRQLLFFHPPRVPLSHLFVAKKPLFHQPVPKVILRARFSHLLSNGCPAPFDT